MKLIDLNALKYFYANLVEVLKGKADVADTNAHISDKSNPHEVTKTQVGLSKVENKSSSEIRSEITSDNVTDALGYTPLDAVGVQLNGKDLAKDSNNKINIAVDSYTKAETDAKLANKEDNILYFNTWADYEKVKNTIPADSYFVVKEDEQANPIPSHNSLMNRDANECHPIKSITGLQAELDKKTDATDTAVLKARVDQIVGEVPPGSADEIADARVMIDGKTSQNLGDAIRTQVTSLKETIDGLEYVMSIGKETTYIQKYDSSLEYPTGINSDFVWMLNDYIPKNSNPIVEICGKRDGSCEVVFLHKNENNTYRKIESSVVAVKSGQITTVPIKNKESLVSDNVYVGFYSKSSGVSAGATAEKITTLRFNYADVESGNITVSGGFNWNWTVNVKYADTVSKEIVDSRVDTNGIKHESLSERLSSDFDTINDTLRIVVESSTTSIQSYDEGKEYTTGIAASLVWVLIDPIPANSVPNFTIHGLRNATGEIVFLHKNENGKFHKVHSQSISTHTGESTNIEISKELLESDLYVGFYSLNSAYSVVADAAAITTMRFNYSDIDNENIVLSGGFNWNWTVDIKYVSSKKEKEKKINAYLPSDIYVANGRTIELYNNQVCLEADKYNIQWVCEVGVAYGRKFSITGVPGTVGNNYALTLNIYDDALQLVETLHTTIHIVSNTIASTKKIVSIGDSLSWETRYQFPEIRLLSDQKVDFVGTRDYTSIASDNNRYTGKMDGRPGFGTADYISGAGSSYFGETHNSFWNGSSFDFGYYVTNTLSGTRPDAVFIWLGTNEIKNPEQYISNMKTMINSIHAYDSNLPIFVVNTIYRSTQDAIGRQGAIEGYNPANGAFKRKEDQYVFDMMTKSTKELKDISNVYVVPLAVLHDSENNFNFVEIPVNPRVSRKITIPEDSIHPQREGCYQIADVFFSWICGYYNQG